MSLSVRAGFANAMTPIQPRVAHLSTSGNVRPILKMDNWKGWREQQQQHEQQKHRSERRRDFHQLEISCCFFLRLFILLLLLLLRTHP
jgi:hypothetical protein